MTEMEGIYLQKYSYSIVCVPKIVINLAFIGEQ